MFKSQLHEYAQKAGLPGPIYEATKQGPSHGPQFKASVTVCGKKYESPAFFGNLRAAEHAAAEVALAGLGKPETGQLHESGLLKTLLQEYAQKFKLPLPFYSVVKTGDVHSPLYTATVEINGVYYDGGQCKTKKETEIKAARNALVAIYADSSALFLNGTWNPAVDEKTSSSGVEAIVEAQSIGNEKPATKEDSTSAVEETPTSAAAGSIPQPKRANKRKKLLKGGKEVRMKASAETAAAISTPERADGSPSKKSAAEATKQESLKHGHLGLLSGAQEEEA